MYIFFLFSKNVYCSIEYYYYFYIGKIDFLIFNDLHKFYFITNKSRFQIDLYYNNSYLLEYFICIIDNAIPSTKQIHPTTMYAIPRNGFFPPKSDVVLRIILLVPSKEDTEYAKIKYVYKYIY